MELHHGQAIERIIRRNGYSITELARLTSVNRRSVYNWFNQRLLKPEVIYRIGTAINYDFSTVFPALFVNTDLNLLAGHNKLPAKQDAPAETGENINWKDKYLFLLERYNEMLTDYLSTVSVDQDLKQE